MRYLNRFAPRSIVGGIVRRTPAAASEITPRAFSVAVLSPCRRAAVIASTVSID
jgi:hypothetical protein